MRLSCYVFLLIAIIFAATSNAASAVQDNTRSLRVAAKTNGDGFPTEEEERAAAIMPKWINKLSSGMTKVKGGIKNIPDSMLNGLFTTMGAAKINPSTVQKYLKITEKTDKRFSFLTKYQTFWDKKYKVAA
ncbi:hypothetical protein JM18_009303 [Phytophthora kernoviae]|uniref:RxLR effector protein n=1 Tax=Phytophthora kernoviae TaxID=325452 RepID=A0A8T0LKQ9_9STRA|nr:hypothetical protein JM16_009282 [Phytophthora kernoviae]KAG2506580.1 hypothetical protein JM18_009303 [Phytophthora kernoviae]